MARKRYTGRINKEKETPGFLAFTDHTPRKEAVGMCAAFKKSCMQSCGPFFLLSFLESGSHECPLDELASS
jgi:hypothetical protein